MTTPNAAYGGGQQMGGTPQGSNMHELADSARAQVGEVKRGIADHARSTVQQVKERASSTFSQRKEQLAGQMGGVAGAIRQSTEKLRSDGHTGIAEYADTLAERVDQAAQYLRDAEPAQLRGDCEGFVRRQPALIAGGALLLGILGARFLKSSQRSNDTRQMPGRQLANVRDYGKGADFGSRPEYGAGGMDASAY